MFTGKLQHDALKQAFLQTMDNDRGNDYEANARIAQLSSTMTDSQINAAYAAARDEATEQNSKKNGFLDRNDPYKNIDSESARQAQFGALQSNDWMNMYPCVPPSLWGVLRGCGCF